MLATVVIKNKKQTNKPTGQCKVEKKSSFSCFFVCFFFFDSATGHLFFIYESLLERLRKYQLNPVMSDYANTLDGWGGKGGGN